MLINSVDKHFDYSVDTSLRKNTTSVFVKRIPQLFVVQFE